MCSVHRGQCPTLFSSRIFHEWCWNRNGEEITAKFHPTDRSYTYSGGTNQGPRDLPIDPPSFNMSFFENVQLEAPSSLHTAKFFIISINPFTGFANRIYALVSALLLCIALGDRVLVIDWPHDDAPRRHPNGEPRHHPA
jgi:hypothetical protein